MKKLFTLLLVLVMAFAMVACEDADIDPEEATEDAGKAGSVKEVRMPEKSVDAVAAELGLEGGEETTYNAIGAIAGKQFNGGAVELYQFDEASAEYEAIDETEAINGIRVWENDGMVLMFPEGKAADQAMINKFEALDFD